MSYLNVEHLDVVQQLKKNFLAIRYECDRLFTMMDAHPKPNGPMMGQNGKYRQSVGVPMYEGENFSIHLKVHPELLDDREKEICFAPGIEEKRRWRQKECPKLWSILSPIDALTGNIGFNKIFPGTRINEHYGVSTTFFRLHLGIVTDPGAKFFIKDAPSYTWQDGEVMAFADGEVLHWVEHTGVNPRTILAIDLKKTML
jgi:hypothetical protein